MSSAQFESHAQFLPFAPAINLVVGAKAAIVKSSAVEVNFSAVSKTRFKLPLLPACEAWVDIFIDGVGVVNREVAKEVSGFGYRHDLFDLEDDEIVFTKPVTGEVLIVVHTKMSELAYKSIDLISACRQKSEIWQDTMEYNVSIDCRLVLLTRPAHGWVKINAVDRMGFEYSPKVGYYGADTFSYKLVSRDGQESEPKCCYVSIVPTGV